MFVTKKIYIILKNSKQKLVCDQWPCCIVPSPT